MLRIVGDINLTDGYFDVGFGIGSQQKKGINSFEEIFFSPKDIWFGNLECVISEFSNKNGVFRKQFLLHPSNLNHLNHFGVLSVANNHTMQHGKDAFHDMLHTINTIGVYYVGSKDKKSISLKHNAYTVGIISFSQHYEAFENQPEYWYQPDYKEIEIEFNKISECQVRIAYIHWGCEFIDHPYIDQQKFARWLIDLGFNLIAGVHPHVLQGYERYNNGYIFYSLGNFLFNMPHKDSRYSIVLNVDYNENLEISYDYVLINKKNKPTIIDEWMVPNKLHFDYLNIKLKQIKENEVYFKNVFNKVAQYRKYNYYFIIKSFFKYNTKDLINILTDFIIRKTVVAKFYIYNKF